MHWIVLFQHRKISKGYALAMSRPMGIVSYGYIQVCCIIFILILCSYYSSPKKTMQNKFYHICQCFGLCVYIYIPSNNILNVAPFPMCIHWVQTQYLKTLRQKTNGTRSDTTSWRCGQYCLWEILLVKWNTTHHDQNPYLVSTYPQL